MEKLFSNLLIIDGSYMLHRSLKVPEMWDLRSTSGKRSGGVYGFLNSLNRVISDHPECYPIIAWDKGRSLRRLEVYPRYKNEHLSKARYLIDLDTVDIMSQDDIDKILNTYANGDISMLEEMRTSIDNSLLERSANLQLGKSREDLDDEDYVSQYIKQKNDIIYLTEKLGIPNIIKSNWEGDDIMTLISRVSTNSYVVTDDRDLIQLISPDISILRPIQGVELEYSSYLEEDDLISPRELVLIKAMVGDGSDAIPSATSELERKFRVGEVRAKKIAKILLSHNEELTDEVKKIITDEIKNPGLGFIETYDLYLRNLKLVDLGLVPDSEEIYNDIKHSIQECQSKVDMIGFISTVAQYEIKTVDYQNIISKLRLSYRNVTL